MRLLLATQIIRETFVISLPKDRSIALSMLCFLSNWEPLSVGTDQGLLLTFSLLRPYYDVLLACLFSKRAPRSKFKLARVQRPPSGRQHSIMECTKKWLSFFPLIRFISRSSAIYPLPLIHDPGTWIEYMLLWAQLQIFLRLEHGKFLVFLWGSHCGIVVRAVGLEQDCNTGGGGWSNISFHWTLG